MDDILWNVSYEVAMATREEEAKKPEKGCAEAGHGGMEVTRWGDGRMRQYRCIYCGSIGYGELLAWKESES
jgi:hypothetical protein